MAMSFQDYLRGTPTTATTQRQNYGLAGVAPSPAGAPAPSPSFMPPQHMGPRPVPGYNERPGFGMPSDFQQWMQGQQPMGVPRGPRLLRNTRAMERNPYGMMGMGTRRPVGPIGQPGPMNQLDQMRAYMQYAQQGKALDAQYQQNLAQGKQQYGALTKQLLEMGPYTPNRGRVPVQNPYLPQTNYNMPSTHQYR